MCIERTSVSKARVLDQGVAAKSKLDPSSDWISCRTEAEIQPASAAYAHHITLVAVFTRRGCDLDINLQTILHARQYQQTKSARADNQESKISPARVPSPMLNQLGQALTVVMSSAPGAKMICLPLPLKTCLTTASATTCGSMTAIPERSICPRWGAIMGVAAQVGCTQVSLTSGAL